MQEQAALEPQGVAHDEEDDDISDSRVGIVSGAPPPTGGGPDPFPVGGQGLGPPCFAAALMSASPLSGRMHFIIPDSDIWSFAGRQGQCGPPATLCTTASIRQMGH